MESNSSNLVLDLPPNKLLNDNQIDESNEMNSNYDMTKILLNKINALNRQSKRKSRSGSINELQFSPTKCLNELNFYSKTKNELDGLEVNSDDETDCDKLILKNQAPINQQSQQQNNSLEQNRNDSQISKILQFKQIKQLNDFLLLNNSLYNQTALYINLQEQFELESLYSSSSESIADWQLDDALFVLQCLNRHNYFRKLHQVPNLILSKNVSELFLDNLKNII